jgi:hypothetical protein
MIPLGMIFTGGFVVVESAWAVVGPGRSPNTLRARMGAKGLSGGTASAGRAPPMQVLNTAKPKMNLRRINWYFTIQHEKTSADLASALVV